MRRVHLRDTRVGMVLGQAVYDDAGEEVVEGGTKLVSDTISTLEAYGIKEILVEDNRVLDVPVQCLYSPALVATISRELREVMIELQGVEQIDPALWQKIEDPVFRMVAELFPEIIGEPDVTGWTTPEEAFFMRPVKVLGLSLLLGKRCGLGIFDLPRLGLSALLMHAGYPSLFPSALESLDEVTAEQPQLERLHPEKSAQVIRAQDYFDPEISEAVLQHHERWDGRGFPAGLKGGGITLAARILAISDTFYSLVSGNAKYKALKPDSAIEAIMAESGSLFDPVLVRLFCRSVPIYPTGVSVRLNTGEIGIVVDANIGTVGRPVIRICFNENGVALANPYDINLRQTDYQDRLILEVL